MKNEFELPNYRVGIKELMIKLPKGIEKKYREYLADAIDGLESQIVILEKYAGKNHPAIEMLEEGLEYMRNTLEKQKITLADVVRMSMLSALILDITLLLGSNREVALAGMFVALNMMVGEVDE